MKDVRIGNRPFGDVQVVVAGDFCQLPPAKPSQYCVGCGGELEIIVADTKYHCSTASILTLVSEHSRGARGGSVLPDLVHGAALIEIRIAILHKSTDKVMPNLLAYHKNYV